MTTSDDAPAGAAAPHDARTELEAVARLVHEEYDDQLGPAAVDECLDRIAARFEDARIRTYVPLLVRRYVREELRARVARPSPLPLPTQRSGDAASASAPMFPSAALGS